MAKRTCSIDGCDRDVIAKGWCEPHYRNARRNNGDPLAPSKLKVGRTPCSVQPCDGFSDRQGMCTKHWARSQKGQDLYASTKEVRGGDVQCAVETCDRERVSKGYCDMHYRRYLAHGDPNIVGVGGNPKSGPCIVDGCDREVVGWGFCDRHYRKYMTYGDPLHVAQKYVTRTFGDHKLGCRVMTLTDTKGRIREVLYDERDESIMLSYDWYVSPTGYVMCPQKPDAIYLARLLLGLHAGDPRVVDHKDGSDTKLDNRRSNLRITSVKRNVENQPVQNYRGSSRFRGVHWDSSRNAWAATASGHHVGRYPTEEAAGAAVARFRAENDIWPGYVPRQTDKESASDQNLGPSAAADAV